MLGFTLPPLVLLGAACTSSGAGDSAGGDSDAGDASIGEPPPAAEENRGDPAAGEGGDGAGAPQGGDPGEGGEVPEGADGDAAPAQVTYYGHAKAVFDRNCATCHREGGGGPFPLTGYENAKLMGPAAVVAVASGRMPPWMPDPDCRHYQRERIMPEEDKLVLQAWVDDGMPEGDPAGATPWVDPNDPVAVLGPVSMTLAAAEPYTPSAATPDDYRCFDLGHVFETETFMRAMNVVPDKKALVHHVLLYVVPKGQHADLAAMDAADPGPGYECFGGPGVGQGDTLGGWVPGYFPILPGKDTANVIPAGSRIVMQIHYNTATAVPEPDQTRLDMFLTDEVPKFAVFTEPLPNLGIEIAAGDPNSEHTIVMRNNGSKTWRIVGVTPHMHTLGTRIRVEAIRADDSVKSCMADIPAWDFNWQQFYTFREDEALELAPGEGVRLYCAYDNSAANQPIVNGKKIEPRDVTWGESTFDEMCLTYFSRVIEYMPGQPEGPMCGGFQACFDTCDRAEMGVSGCGLECSFQADGACINCVVGGMVRCAIPECPADAQKYLDCLQDCGAKPNPGACITNDCVEQIKAFETCVVPLIDSGKCDGDLGGCNVNMKTP